MLIRNLRQLKTVVLLHRCLICAPLLWCLNNIMLSITIMCAIVPIVPLLRVIRLNVVAPHISHTSSSYPWIEFSSSWITPPPPPPPPRPHSPFWVISSSNSFQFRRVYDAIYFPPPSALRQYSMDRFRGRIALVTGSSAGIGVAVAKRLCAEHGMKVVGCARRIDRLRDLETQINGKRSRIIKRVPSVKSSLLLKIDLQDTQTLQVNYIRNYVQN